MPKEFRLIDKYCVVCGKKLKLNTIRDIIRKNYCSKECVSKYIVENNILTTKGIKYKDEWKEHMRKPKKNHTNSRKGVPRPEKTGNKNPNWKGGRSFEEYGACFNRVLKEKIRKRDNFICQECNKTEKELCHTLSIHHIDYNKKNNSELNLISLCKKCHGKVHWDEEKWSNYFKNKVGDLYPC